MSVSKVDCAAVVRGKGGFVLSLYRHLAPVTVDAVTDALPLSSRAAVYPGMVTLLTTIKTGVEKQRKDYSRGDVAFFAGTGSVCVFLKNAQSDSPLNPIGRIESGLESLDAVRPGDVVQISKAAQEAVVQT
ncbi:MAG: hypothetical protein JRM86_00200 [Nitrososphaerota archaeon]|nr:hypothetical protein [Nitrososphaerota archaeon]MDG7022456.1 hypothetical protein [Nitrososphaerota archaeon]